MFCFKISVFPGGMSGLKKKTHLPMQETQETRVQSLGQEDPLEKELIIHCKFLPGKSHEQRSLVGYSTWTCKRVGQD